MKNNLILPLFIILFLTSCFNEKKDDVSSSQVKFIPGNYFKNPEAERLNEKGIDMTIEGDLEGGKLSFLKSLEIEPNNPTTLSNLGLNRFEAYDYDVAVKYYQKSYQISDSTYHLAAVNLGLTYFYKREFKKGLEITDYIIQNTNDKDILSSAYVHRALNYLGIDECSKAQSDLNYIKENFRGIGNTEYHIMDLTEKIQQCIYYTK